MRLPSWRIVKSWRALRETLAKKPPKKRKILLTEEEKVAALSSRALKLLKFSLNQVPELKKEFKRKKRKERFMV